ncbi:hypothetical protein KUL152_01040 [Tenacibaculum sp. KUL152]|nr:hypothetical protein KUL152_01040 [Tenacibaculum sp. KUL152]
MKTLFISTVLVVTSFCVHTAVNAETIKHTKRDNAEYVAVAHYQVKRAHREEAKQLIRDYLMPAAKTASNSPPKIYFMMTGDESVMVIYPLSLGPGELAYTETWEDKKFKQAVSELAGGEKEGKEKLRRFGELFTLKEMNLGFEDTSL